MKIPNWPDNIGRVEVSLARIVSEDSQRCKPTTYDFSKSSKDS